MNKLSARFGTFALFALSLIFGSGCVSAGRYHELEAQDNQNKQDLAADEARITELNGKLGIADTQRTKLEGSVSNMKTAMEELQKRRQETEKRLADFRELTSKFSQLVNSGKLSVKMVNGRMVVALSTDILFSSGSSKLSTPGVGAIKEVTKLLLSLEGRKYQIEGHTDNVPIKNGPYASNWELASARAVTVVKNMLDAGMPADRISGATYADTQPITSNDTDEGKKQNRRIAIAIVPDLSGLPGNEELNKMVTSAAEKGSEKTDKK